MEWIYQTTTECNVLNNNYASKNIIYRYFICVFNVLISVHSHTLNNALSTIGLKNRSNHLTEFITQFVLSSTLMTFRHINLSYLFKCSTGYLMLLGLD